MSVHTNHHAFTTFALLGALSGLPSVSALRCFKMQDGTQVCLDNLPVAARVGLLVAGGVILALSVTMCVCMRRHRNTTRSSPDEALEYNIEAEQMQGPPTILETQYNLKSGQLTGVYAPQSPACSTPIRSPRARSPYQCPKSPAFPERAQVHSHRLSQPHFLQGPMGMPVPQVQPQTAPASRASFASTASSSSGSSPPSYKGPSPEISYPEPPKTAFVSGGFQKPPSHPSLSRKFREAPV